MLKFVLQALVVTKTMLHLQVIDLQGKFTEDNASVDIEVMENLAEDRRHIRNHING